MFGQGGATLPQKALNDRHGVAGSAVKRGAGRRTFATPSIAVSVLRLVGVHCLHRRRLAQCGPAGSRCLPTRAHRRSASSPDHEVPARVDHGKRAWNGAWNTPIATSTSAGRRIDQGCSSAIRRPRTAVASIGRPRAGRGGLARSAGIAVGVVSDRSGSRVAPGPRVRSPASRSRGRSRCRGWRVPVRSGPRWPHRTGTASPRRCPRTTATRDGWTADRHRGDARTSSRPPPASAPSACARRTRRATCGGGCAASRQRRAGGCPHR
jgi:hypothetical protein